MCHSGCNCGSGKCTVSWVVKILLAVGGLNWGLVGLGMLMNRDLNVVYMLLGDWPTVEAIVYLLVGVAAVMSFFHCKCKKCMSCNCATCAVDGHKEGGDMAGGNM